MGFAQKSGKRGSHYYYSNATIDKNGKKEFKNFKGRIKNWRSTTHIFTVRYTEDGREWQYAIPQDLDYDKSNKNWHRRGKMDAAKVWNFWQEHYPVTAKYCALTRSTSGKGLGLVCFFQPFIRDHGKTGGITYLANRVHQLMRDVLNYHGLGADEKATGIARWTPNWRNGRKRLYFPGTQAMRDVYKKEPTNILTDIYNELRRSPAFKSPTRSDFIKNGKRFAVKDKANSGLANIYACIINEQPETLEAFTTYDELMSVSGLSLPTIRKYLKSATWCDFTVLRGQGVKILIKPSDELTAMAFSEQPRQEMTKTIELVKNDDWDLQAPERIEQGHRNDYIWRRAVLLRNSGVTIDQSIGQIKSEIRRIPGYQNSRNCSNFVRIISSVYRRVPKLKRKIFSLESIAKHNIIPGSQFLISSSSNSKNLLCIREKKIEDKFLGINEGAAGRPGETSPKMLELELIRAFAPKAADAISGEIRHCDEKSESQNEPRIDLFASVNVKALNKSKPFKVARIVAAKYKHPGDKFAEALKRCQRRASDRHIFYTLRKASVSIDRCELYSKRYKAPTGKFRKVLSAFSKLPKHLRDEILDFNVTR